MVTSLVGLILRTDFLLHKCKGGECGKISQRDQCQQTCRCDVIPRRTGGDLDCESSFTWDLFVIFIFDRLQTSSKGCRGFVDNDINNKITRSIDDTVKIFRIFRRRRFS